MHEGITMQHLQLYL